MDDKFTEIIWSSIKLVIYSVLIIVAVKLLLNSEFEAFFSLSFASILVCCLDANGREYLKCWVNGASPFQFLKGMLLTNNLSSPESFFQGCAVKLCVVFIVIPVMAGIMGYFVIIVMWFITIKKLIATISEPSYTEDVNKKSIEKNVEGKSNTEENWNDHQSEDDAHNNQNDKVEQAGHEEDDETYKDNHSEADEDEEDEWVIVEEDESEEN